MKRTGLCCLLLSVGAACLVILSAPKPAFAQSSSTSQASRDDLEGNFRQFHNQYQLEIKAKNTAYLKAIHPKLPAEAYEFFFDVTLNMMRHADENEGVEPKIECQDFNICKVIYPQPNDSWAAQRFIQHEGNWRWLDQ